MVPASLSWITSSAVNNSVNSEFVIMGTNRIAANAPTISSSLIVSWSLYFFCFSAQNYSNRCSGLSVAMRLPFVELFYSWRKKQSRMRSQSVLSLVLVSLLLISSSTKLDPVCAFRFSYSRTASMSFFFYFTASLVSSFLFSSLQDIKNAAKALFNLNAHFGAKLTLQSLHHRRLTLQFLLKLD